MSATTQVSRTLRLELVGPAAADGRLRVDVLVELARSLQAAVTRLAYAGRGEPTVRPGRPSAEVSELTRLELVGFHSGSTVLELGLAEGARPFDGFDLGADAVDRLEEGLVALDSGAELPSLWDRGIVEAVGDLLRIFDHGIDELLVEWPNDLAPRRARLTREARDRLRGARAPRDRQRVEIEGRLLMADFSAARDRARIHRPLESPVLCAFPRELEETVLGLLRRYVHASGEATVDKAGTITEMMLESLEDAEPSSGRSFWELPTLTELAEEQGITPVDQIENLADGTWPEDESVEDFLDAIESRG